MSYILNTLVLNDNVNYDQFIVANYLCDLSAYRFIMLLLIVFNYMGGIYRPNHSNIMYKMQYQLQ